MNFFKAKVWSGLFPLLVCLFCFLSAQADTDFAVSDNPFGTEKVSGYIDFGRETLPDSFTYDNAKDRYAGRFVANHLPAGMTFLPQLDSAFDYYCPFDSLFKSSKSEFSQKYVNEYKAFASGKLDADVLTNGLYAPEFLNYYYNRPAYFDTTLSHPFFSQSERYFISDDIKSIYPDAVGLAVDDDNAKHAYFVSQYFDDDFNQYPQCGIRIPYQCYRNQELNVHFRCYFLCLGPEQHYNYDYNAVNVLAETLVRDTAYNYDQIWFTVSPDGYETQPLLNVWEQGHVHSGDLMTDFHGLRLQPIYDGVNQPYPNVNIGFDVDFNLSFWGKNGDDSSIGDYLDFMLKFEVSEMLKYRVLIDSISVDFVPRYICASKDCVSPGENVALSVRNYSAGSMFLWDYYSAQNNDWRPLIQDTVFVESDGDNAEFSVVVPDDAEGNFRVRAKHLFERKGNTYNEYQRYQYLTFCSENGSCLPQKSADADTLLPDTAKTDTLPAETVPNDTLSADTTQTEHVHGCPKLDTLKLYVADKECSVWLCNRQACLNIDTIKSARFMADEVSFEVGNHDVDLMLFYACGDSLRCKAVVSVEDTIRPKWSTSVADTTIYLGDWSELPPTSIIYATDNCKGVIAECYQNSTRSASAYDCGYYSYSVVREYVAYDANGNHADTLLWTYVCADTVAPSFSLPAGWQEDMTPFLPIGVCQFGVPNVIDDIPSGAVSDNTCPLSNLILTQYPEVGTPITKSIYATVYAADPCGNVDSVKRFVYVPPVRQIVSIDFTSDTACLNSGQKQSLLSPQILTGKGYSWVKDSSEWVAVNTAIDYDVYRNKIGAENLVYSSNRRTYQHLFVAADGSVDVALRDSLLNIPDSSFAGRYVYVAMDTLTQCTDTAVLDLTLQQKPIVSITAPARLSVCPDSVLFANDLSEMVHLQTARSNYGYWTDGTQQWSGSDEIIVDGDSTQLYYTAVNFCGSATTDLLVLHSTDKPITRGLVLTGPSAVHQDEYAVLQLSGESPLENATWYVMKGSEPDEATDEVVWTFRDSSSNAIYPIQIDSATVFYAISRSANCLTYLSNQLAIDYYVSIPTAITPYTLDGLNDCFMPGHKVMIFDRFGNWIFTGDDGWCGTLDGGHALAGVYYYVLWMADGKTLRGSVEIVRKD